VVTELQLATVTIGAIPYSLQPEVKNRGTVSKNRCKEESLLIKLFTSSYFTSHE
jgi:hypothetical protein